MFADLPGRYPGLTVIRPKRSLSYSYERLSEWLLENAFAPWHFFAWKASDRFHDT